MMNIQARAVFAPEGPFRQTEIQRPNLEPHDVLIEIDISTMNN